MIGQTRSDVVHRLDCGDGPGVISAPEDHPLGKARREQRQT